MTFSTAVSLATAILILFVLAELMMEEGRNRSRGYIAAILLLVLTAGLTTVVRDTIGRKNILMLLMKPFGQWTFLLGPFLLAYQKSVSGTRIRWIELLHLSPAVFWSFAFPTPPPTPDSMVSRIHGLTILLSLLAYCILVLVRIHSYAKSNQDRFSYVNLYIDMRWLRAIMLSLLLISIVISGIQVWNRRFPDPSALEVLPQTGHPETTILIHAIAELAFVFVFSLFAIKQDRVIRGVSTNRISRNQVPAWINPADVGKDDEMYAGLLMYMDDKKPFRNPQLTLDGLSSAMGIGRNDLSRVINTKTGENFFHFVNGYRARDFREVIKENIYPDYTLLAVALECGFNSKSTFNAAVRKELGMTPSQVGREIG